MTDPRLVEPGDRAGIVDVLARAFADDPAFSFIFPDRADRVRRLPRLFALIYDSDGRAGPRFVTGGGEAVTLWRAPGRAEVGWGEMLLHGLPLLGAFGGAVFRGLAVADAIESHFPEGPFWYLHAAACDPAHQGKGHGSAAIRAGITAAPEGVPCYLETATEGNLALYMRLGFAITDEWQVPKGGPRFWSMLRSSGAPSPLMGEG